MSIWSDAFKSVCLFAEEQLSGILPLNDTKRYRRTEQLERFLRNVFENVPLEVYLFTGTAIAYCVYQKLCHYRDDSNGGSHPSQPRKRLTAEELAWEAKIHAQKKQSNYKDPSLQAVMSAMSETKKKLRRVDNPEEARKQKLKTLKVQAKSKATTPLGISTDSLQGKLSSLKKVEKDNNIQKENEVSFDSYLKEWRNRLRNVAIH